MKGISGTSATKNLSGAAKYYVFLYIFLCAIICQRSCAIPLPLFESNLYNTHSAQQYLPQQEAEQEQEQQRQLLQQRQQQQQQQLLDTPKQLQQQQQQHQYQHHLQHRSVSNMAAHSEQRISSKNNDVYNKISNEFCLNADHLKNMLVQANKTYDYITNILGDYTMSQYRKTPEEVHVTWMKHMFQLEHPLTKVLDRDFYKQPDRQHFTKFQKEPLNREMIYKEMQKVYTTLQTLKTALDDVLQGRRDNRMELLHDLHNNLANFNRISEFFAEANKMVRVDMHEVVKFMEKLDIPLPPVDAQNAYHSRMEVRDWLLASEHLSVTQYLRALYAILLEKCPDFAQQ